MLGERQRLYLDGVCPCPVSSLRWFTLLSLVQHMGGLNGHISGLPIWKGTEGLYYARRAARGYLCPVSSLRWFTLLSLVHHRFAGASYTERDWTVIVLCSASGKGLLTFTVCLCPVPSLRWFTLSSSVHCRVAFGKGILKVIPCSASGRCSLGCLSCVFSTLANFCYSYYRNRVSFVERDLNVILCSASDKMFCRAGLSSVFSALVYILLS